jgi:hypothetical protein
MGTVSLGWLAVIDSAFDLTRPGKANEGDGLGSASFASPQEATHDFFDLTGINKQGASPAIGRWPGECRTARPVAAGGSLE